MTTTRPSLWIDFERLPKYEAFPAPLSVDDTRELERQAREQGFTNVQVIVGGHSHYLICFKDGECCDFVLPKVVPKKDAP